MSSEPWTDSAAMHGSRRWPLVLLGLFIGVLLVLLPLLAIGVIGPGFGDGRKIEVRGEQVAFAVTVPSGLSAIDDVWAAPDQGCPIIEYDFGTTNSHSPLAVLAVDKDCDVDPDDMIMNGNHGNYRTIEDVPNPIDVQQVDTELGPAQVFVQEYEEHTMISRTYQEPVAIVSLDHPVDPQYPTLLLRSEAGKLSTDRFTEVVASLEEPTT